MKVSSKFVISFKKVFLEYLLLNIGIENSFTLLTSVLCTIALEILPPSLTKPSSVLRICSSWFMNRLSASYNVTIW